MNTPYIDDSMFDKFLRSILRTNNKIILLDGNPKNIGITDICAKDIGSRYEFYTVKEPVQGATDVITDKMDKLYVLNMSDIPTILEIFKKAINTGVIEPQVTALTSQINNIKQTADTVNGERNTYLNGATISGSTLTFTRANNGSNVSISLPSGGSSDSADVSNKADRDATNIGTLSADQKWTWLHNLGIIDHGLINIGHENNIIGDPSQGYAYSIVLGLNNTAKATSDSICLGHNASCYSSGSTAIGVWYEASTTYRTAASRDSLAIGTACDLYDANFSTGLGAYNKMRGENNLSIGSGTRNTLQENNGKNNIIIGASNQILASQTTIAASSDHSDMSYSDNNYPQRNLILGSSNIITDVSDNVVIGNGNIVPNNVSNVFVMGVNITANVSNSFYIGKSSTVETNASTTSLGTTNTASLVNGINFNIVNTSSGVLTIGNKTANTRIQNVADGLIGANSSDAVNGAQLYNLANTVVKKDASNLEEADVKAWKSKLGISSGGGLDIDTFIDQLSPTQIDKLKEKLGIKRNGPSNVAELDEIFGNRDGSDV